MQKGWLLFQHEFAVEKIKKNGLDNTISYRFQVG